MKCMGSQLSIRKVNNPTGIMAEKYKEFYSCWSTPFIFKDTAEIAFLQLTELFSDVKPAVYVFLETAQGPSMMVGRVMVCIVSEADEGPFLMRISDYERV